MNNKKTRNVEKLNVGKYEEDSTVDLTSLKITGSKSPITSSPALKEKGKTPSYLDFDNEKIQTQRPKKINATAAVAAKMDPTVPPSPKGSVSSFETSSITSTQSNGSKKKGGKKKKATKKKRESALPNETPTTSSSTSLGMSPVLNYNGVSTTMNPQMYYQQLYNNAAAQVAAMPSPYFSAYNQSPYFGANGVNVASTLANPYNTSPYLGTQGSKATKPSKK